MTWKKLKSFLPMHQSSRRFKVHLTSFFCIYFQKECIIWWRLKKKVSKSMKSSWTYYYLYYLYYIYFAKSYSACVYTVPFDIWLIYFAKNYSACTLHCSIRHLADLFRQKLHRLFLHCSIRHLADLFREKLHRFYFTLFHSTFGWSISPKATPLVIWGYAVPFQCAISVSRANPFSVCLNHFILFCVVLQTRAELFAFGLVQSTISGSNSTWTVRPFIIWLRCLCLGCLIHQGQLNRLQFAYAISLLVMPSCNLPLDYLCFCWSI